MLLRKEYNIWFSRHELSEEQLKELEKRNIFELQKWNDLASITITPENLFNFLKEFFERIYNISDEKFFLNLFGVIPPVLRSILLAISDLTDKKNYKIVLFTFESWNILRAKEGEKPEFAHKEFVCTGYYFLPLTISDETLKMIANAYK